MERREYKRGLKEYEHAKSRGLDDEDAREVAANSAGDHGVKNVLRNMSADLLKQWLKVVHPEDFDAVFNTEESHKSWPSIMDDFFTGHDLEVMRKVAKFITELYPRGEKRRIRDIIFRPLKEPHKKKKLPMATVTSGIMDRDHNIGFGKQKLLSGF